MTTTEKLLLELVKITYANLQFNILLTRTVVAAVATIANTTDNYNKEMENIYKAIDSYISKLDKEIGGSDGKQW